MGDFMISLSESAKETSCGLKEKAVTMLSFKYCYICFFNSFCVFPSFFRVKRNVTLMKRRYISGNVMLCYVMLCYVILCYVMPNMYFTSYSSNLRE